MTFWNRLRMIVLFFRLVRDPNRTELIFKGVRIASKDKDQTVINAIEQNAISHPLFREMWNTRYVPDVPSLEDLSRLPDGTFGNAFYNHMIANALDPGLFPRFEPQRPIDYLSLRIYQDHDLWHALLGYGVDLEDEIALQAFGVAQFRSPLAALLVAGGLLNLIRTNPMRVAPAFEKAVDGYRRGRHAPFLLSYRLHEMFGKPLEEVRELCGITPSVCSNPWNRETSLCQRTDM